MRRCSRKKAALDRLEGFASEHGPRFYGLPLNEGTVTLERGADRGAGCGSDGLVPFHAGETLRLAIGRLGRAGPLRSDDVTEETLDPIVHSQDRRSSPARSCTSMIPRRVVISPSSCNSRATALTVVRCTPSRPASDSWVSSSRSPARSWAVSSQRAARASIGWKLLHATDLHDLRQQIIGIAAEQVAKMARAALRFLNASPSARALPGPPTITSARVKAGCGRS